MPSNDKDKPLNPVIPQDDLDSPILTPLKDNTDNASLDDVADDTVDKAAAPTPSPQNAAKTEAKEEELSDLEKMEKILEQVYKDVSSLNSTLVEALEKNIGVSDKFEALKDKIDEKTGYREALKTAGEKLTAFKDELVTGVAKGFDNVIRDAIKELQPKDPDRGPPSVRQQIEQIKDKVDEQTGYRAALQSASDKLSEVGNQLSAIKNDLVTGVAKGVDNVINDAMKEILPKAGAGPANTSFSDKIDQLKEGYKEALQSASEKLSDLGAKVANIQEDLVKGVTKGLDNIINDAEDALGALLSKQPDASTMDAQNDIIANAVQKQTKIKEDAIVKKDIEVEDDTKGNEVKDENTHQGGTHVP